MAFSPKPLFTSSLQVWFFMAGCLLLNGLLRIILVPHGLWVDEAEQVYLAQWFSVAAYEGQPPLYTWIHHFVFSLTGPSIFFVVLFKVLLLSLIYLGIRKIFQLVNLSDPAVIAGLLSFVYMLNLWDETPWRTNTILVTTATVWAAFLVVRIVLKGQWKDYLWLGVIAGIGFLSKYIFILPALGMLIATLSLQEGRKRILSPFIFIAVAGFIGVISVHLIWLFGHVSAIQSSIHNETSYSEQLSYMQSLWLGLISLMDAVISFAAVWLIITFLFFIKSWMAMKSSPAGTWVYFFGRYLLAVTILLIGIIISLGISDFEKRYLVPCYIFIPVYVFIRMASPLSNRFTALPWFQWTSAAVLVVTLLFNTLPLGIKPLLGKPGYMHIPYDKIARQIIKESRGADHIMVNDIVFAGNLALHAGKEHTVVLWDDFRYAARAMASDSSFSYVYVWIEQKTSDESIPSELKLLPEFREESIHYFEIPYHQPAEKTCRIGVVRM